MADPKRLLILGGTTEAAALAEAAMQRFGERLEVTTSLAGRLSVHRSLPGKVRVGGFGGVDGMAQALKNEGYSWVVDATHPFAATISQHAYDACLISDVPRLQLMRRPWAADPSHPWIEAKDLEDAASLLPGIGRRVFLTVGRRGLEAFSTVKNAWFLVRLIEAPARRLPLPDHQVIAARPPHPLEEEIQLMKAHRIDLLVSKQSGGEVTETKIAAANQLGIGIVMIRRPLPEPGPLAETVEEALGWLAENLG
jgi:precorrin-6A/cobalt-precorrin-6A reductase